MNDGMKGYDQDRKDVNGNRNDGVKNGTEERD